MAYERDRVPVVEARLEINAGVQGTHYNDGRPFFAVVPRVILPLSVEESTRQRELLQYSSVVESRKWKPSLEQKQILESMWASGTRKPPCEAQIDEITSHLHSFMGKRKPKMYIIGFAMKVLERNAENNNQKPYECDLLTDILLYIVTEVIYRSYIQDSDCSAQSNQLENRVNVEGEEEEAQRTLELFPLHPDRGRLL
ncbi:uncharacterized protein LOC131874397 [Cryptomeria japonica]|uniref:uncharacterized protein LOC131874397 n=1 Tax=Cryptomeria japonica TaxID=3369 RepID=UPI0027DA8728|nr:uncharacterized protein LOC131874397 [Cryptomeria japonica]